MSYPTIVAPPCVTIHTFSVEALGPKEGSTGNNLAANAAGTVYPSANLAIYIPMWVMQPLVAVQMFAYSGATVGTNNIDVGIYDGAGNKLVSSGSTLTANASDLQVFNITDTLLGTGLHYLAVAMDGTTDTLFRINNSIPLLRGWGVRQQASAFALPATATFAVMAQNYLPTIGLTTRSVL